MTAASADGGMPCVDLKYESLRHLQDELGPYLATEGFFLQDATEFAPSDVLRFRVMLPGEFVLVEGVGVVIWVREPENAGPLDPPGVAVGFATLSEQGRELVERMAQTHIEKGGKPFDLSRPSAQGMPLQEEAPVSTPNDETANTGFKFEVRGGEDESDVDVNEVTIVAMTSETQESEASDELELDEGEPEEIAPMQPLPFSEPVDPEEPDPEGLTLDHEAIAQMAGSAPVSAQEPADMQKPEDLEEIPGEPEDAAAENLASNEASFWVETETEVDAQVGAKAFERPVVGPDGEVLPATAVEPPPELPTLQNPKATGQQPSDDRDELEVATVPDVDEPDQPVGGSVGVPESVMDMHLRDNDEDDSGVFREEPPEEEYRPSWQLDGDETPAKRSNRWLFVAAAVVVALAGWYFWPQIQGLLVGGDQEAGIDVVEESSEGLSGSTEIGDDELEAAVFAAVEALKEPVATDAEDPVSTQDPPARRSTVSGEPASVVTDILWSPGETSTVITIVGNGEFDAAQVRADRLSAPPRILVRIAGIQQGYRPFELMVGTRHVDRLRIGHHPEISPPSLWVVVDLETPSAELRAVDVVGSSVSIQVGR